MARVPENVSRSHTLWHLKNPTSRDNGLWLTAFESEPIKTATLTIGGSLNEVEGGYQINVERDAIGRIIATTLVAFSAPQPAAPIHPAKC